MNVYVDASFLVSLYSADSNSIPATRAMQRTDGLLFVTNLAELEVVNAFELRVFRKEIIALQAETSLKDFAADQHAGIFRLCGIPEGSFERAHQIARQTTASMGTRTTDLLHVAAALELGSERLYSFDDRQRKLAQAVKLSLNSLA